MAALPENALKCGTDRLHGMEPPALARGNPTPVVVFGFGILVHLFGQSFQPLDFKRESQAQAVVALVGLPAAWLMVSMPDTGAAAARTLHDLPPLH